MSEEDTEPVETPTEAETAVEEEALSTAEDSFDSSEIEELVTGVAGSGASKVVKSNGALYEEPGKVLIQRYDFTNPVILTQTDLQKIRARAEKFCYYLGGHLSMFLRKELNINLNNFETSTYQEFTKGIAEPSCVRLFKLEDLHGVCVLDLDPKMSISIVEVLLGGQGSVVAEARDLTDIEKALIDDVVDIVIEEYARQWEDVVKLKPKIIGRENSGRFLQTSPKDALMLTVTFEASFGEVSGNITLAVPYYTISPVISKLASSDSEKDDRTEGSSSSKWHTCYDTINVPISAEWDLFPLSVGEILGLKSGDIVELNNDLITNTTLRIEGKNCFIGEVGIENGRAAVRINESCDTGEN